MSFTVRFLNYAGDDLLGTATVEWGEDATPLAPTPEIIVGKKFTGWNVPITHVVEDMTVRPIYVDVHTVTFYNYKGDGTLSVQEVEDGQDAKAPKEEKIAGKTFTGWDTDFTNVHSDLSVHPLYTDIYLTVRFLNKDGTDVWSTQSIRYGDNAIPPSPLKYTGFIFIGWNTAFTHITEDKTIRPVYREIPPHPTLNFYEKNEDGSSGSLKKSYSIGAYNMEDYSYIDTDIEWCSVEHQCSGLQALEGCALVLKNEKYKKAAELVRDQLILKCYDKENGRFYQGINGGIPDAAWALDCTTWAGSLVFSVVQDDASKACFSTARSVYLTEEKQIVKSSDQEHYNQTYSDSRSFTGFKPYSDRTSDYAGAPDIIWTEGTLGYASLALVLGEEAEAKKYVDECIALQNCSGSTGGVIYVTETYASLPWEFHVWESVVSSSWLYLLIKNPDVLFPRTLRQVYYMAKITNIKDQRP